MKVLSRGIFFLCALVSSAQAEQIFVGNLDGLQEVPANSSTATGFGRVTLNDAETQITVSVYYSGLSAVTTNGHIHGPRAVGVNGPIIFNLAPTAGQTSGSVVNATFAITPTQVADLKAGLHYFNIHTSALPGGEIRGQILPSSPYLATISAKQEVPRNASLGVGRAAVSLNAAQTQALVTVQWSGTTGPLTSGHVHTGFFGANGGIVCNLSPPAVVAGSIVDFLCPFTTAQVTTLKRGGFYINLHTSANPGGEIRGQILPSNALLGRLNAAQEVAPNTSTATGFGFVEINEGTNVATVNVSWTGLTGPATMGHIHAGEIGANGPVICDLAPAAVASGSVADASCTFDAAQVALIKSGGTYFNIHTAANPGGEIRGQINPLLRDGFEDNNTLAPLSLSDTVLKSGVQMPAAIAGSTAPAQCHEAEPKQ
jgi:trimeric autotransporter adhesin